MYELRHGMEGYPVKLLQYALDRTGKDELAADGIFGRRTAKALLRFQREQGLSADAVAGKLTWAALYPYISGYTVHKVIAGDTFEGIAKRYQTTVAALITANPTLAHRQPTAGAILTIPMPFSTVMGNIPSSSLLMELMIKGLTMRYPFLTSCEIGRSVMGKRILSVSVGHGSRQIGYIAAHDAKSWIGTAVLLRFLEEYAAAVAADGTIGGFRARELYGSATLHVVPQVNPDGVDLVNGALDPFDSFYAQAKAMAAYCPQIPFPTGWKSNILGVDLSLQYPTDWNSIRRTSFQQGIDRPGPVGFAGSEPLIAPENRAMARWTGNHDLALTLSFDRGYANWFIHTWHRPAVTVDLENGAKGEVSPAFEEIYRTVLPILARHLAVNP